MRVLAPEFFFGIHSFKENEPFIIIRTEEFDNAFAAILRWEKSMPFDLAEFFDLTAEELENPGYIPEFKDIVLLNQDVRILNGKEGTILIYGFVDTKTIVLTTHVETFNEITRRIKLPRQVVR